jgi:hypothetical protein
MCAGSSVITRGQVIISNADATEQRGGTSPSVRPLGDDFASAFCIVIPVTIVTGNKQAQSRPVAF